MQTTLPGREKGGEARLRESSDGAARPHNCRGTATSAPAHSSAPSVLRCASAPDYHRARLTFAYRLAHVAHTPIAGFALHFTFS